MTTGSFHVEFGQAAIGDDADVLRQILTPQFNLAVWDKAGERLSRSAYMQSLNPKSLGRSLPWKENYFKTLFSLPISRQPVKRQDMTRELNRHLVTAGFPARALFQKSQPDDLFTRNDLASALYDFSRHFAQAIDKNSKITLLVFRPDGNKFWHNDGGSVRGIITLRGNEGTLWRPDSSLVGETCTKGIYWGDVDPEKQDFIQTISPGSMAIFKCRDHVNPLVHATPASKECRLVAIMSPERR